jgi:hypothetical protein
LPKPTHLLFKRHHGSRTCIPGLEGPLTVSDIGAWMPIDQSMSVAVNLKEGICETVTSAHPHLTEDKESEEKKMMPMKHLKPQQI